MALSGVRFEVKLSGTQTNAADLSTPQEFISLITGWDITNGTTAGTANTIWHDQRTLTASSTENLDLAGGLTSQLTGATLTFTKLCGIYVFAATANTNNVEIGGAAATQLTGWFKDVTDIVVLGPGDFYGQTRKAGVTIGAGSTDLLKIANSSSGTSVIYNIALVGIA